MWLSKQQKKAPIQQTAGLGEVTLSGAVVAVALDGERRGLEVYGPAGLRWRPCLGQKALVLKAEGIPCVAGVQTDGSGLEPGELALESAGGAAVCLDNQGQVILKGRTEIEGTLCWNGRELTELIREIAVQAVGGNAGG